MFFPAFLRRHSFFQAVLLPPSFPSRRAWAKCSDVTFVSYFAIRTEGKFHCLLSSFSALCK